MSILLKKIKLQEKWNENLPNQINSQDETSPQRWKYYGLSTDKIWYEIIYPLTKRHNCIFRTKPFFFISNIQTLQTYEAIRNFKKQTSKVGLIKITSQTGYQNEKKMIYRIPYSLILFLLKINEKMPNQVQLCKSRTSDQFISKTCIINRVKMCILWEQVSLQSMKLTEKKVSKQGPRKQILHLLKLYMKLHLGVTLLRKRMDFKGTKQEDSIIFIFCKISLSFFFF